MLPNCVNCGFELRYAPEVLYLIAEVLLEGMLFASDQAKEIRLVFSEKLVNEVRFPSACHCFFESVKIELPDKRGKVVVPEVFAEYLFLQGFLVNNYESATSRQPVDNVEAVGIIDNVVNADKKF